MNINIFRRRFTPWSVDGTMVIGGKIFCDTLERPNRHLPAGRYKISLIPTKQKKVSETKKKNKYERGKYEIVIKPVILLRSNYVPRTVRRRARFVPGNGPLRLRNKSIILGKSHYTGEGDEGHGGELVVTQSEECYNDFCQLLNEEFKRMKKKHLPCRINLFIRDLGVDEIPFNYLLIFQ